MPIPTLSPSARVRETALQISSNATLVHVNQSSCKQAAIFLHKVLTKRGTTPLSISKNWCSANGLHPPHPSPEALKWIFLVDTLNFSLWTPHSSAPYTVRYNHQSYTGYWALCAAINRALDQGIAITDPYFFATLEPDMAAYIFRSDNSTPIPLLDQRVQALREAGTVLMDRFEGSVEKLVDSCNGSAQTLVEIVVHNFQSFDDSLPSDAYLKFQPHASLKRLCFYKRAQILVADIWACFSASQLYNFSDISSLTMFADYRVPQILAWLRAIEYSDELQMSLKDGIELQRGCVEEVEIRGCSIHAVELIRSELENIHASTTHSHLPSNLNSVLIDFALWDYAKQHNDTLSHIPIHHVRSIFY